MSPIYIKHTLDGRKVEVVAGRICLDGQPEADHLVVLDEHPNRQAILKVQPRATHMAGRLPLTMAETSVAQAAMRRATDAFDGSRQAVTERLRRAVWRKTLVDGAE
ncbi:MAG: hypothetical protein HY021_05130 [Burkholderiales bacterium]|nr:hypothetical protein [Burkholderiales bacterium]